MFVLWKMFSQRGISKHLATHLAQMEKESDETRSTMFMWKWRLLKFFASPCQR